MSEAFYWVGVVVTAAFCVVGLLIVLIWLWANLIHNRFSAIFFRPTKRRISLASWHQTRLTVKGGNMPSGDEDWPADDHVIGPRPFYLSYKIGEVSLFVMFGTLRAYRHSSIRGRHP